jgi:ribosomal protein S18 acetylase RimI-like enzyme
MAVEIKKLGYNDLNNFKALVRVFEDVFEMKDFNIPDDDYLQQLLKKDSFLVFVALSEDKVVGGLTAYVLQQYYSVRPLVYIYDLAIKTDYQRQGIGSILIAGITKYCQETGMEEVFVQADEEDGYALEFYHSTGATAEKVVHFYYPLNSR